MKVVLVLVTALALLGLLPGQPASAAESHQSHPRSVIPQCTDISFKGSTGQINIRTSPTRFVAWNIAMSESWRNDGPWRVDVYVNNRKVDHKDQDYQPHGSVNPADLPPSSFVSIEAWHTDLIGTEHYFVPNQCFVP